MSNICEIKVPDVGNVHDIDVVEVSIQAGDVIELLADACRCPCVKLSI